jgi:two-component system OmpR family response regulator
MQVYKDEQLCKNSNTMSNVPLLARCSGRARRILSEIELEYKQHMEGLVMQGMLNIRSASQYTGHPGRRHAPLVDAGLGGAPRALLHKVLVVDDEEDLADMAAALLGTRGLEVLVAYSAHEALRILQDNPDIDALFSDIVMPGMTGLQLADAVTEMYPEVKIVLASGYTLPKLLTERERAYLYTSKPYRIDAVLKLLGT